MPSAKAGERPLFCWRFSSTPVDPSAQPTAGGVRQTTTPVTRRKQSTGLPSGINSRLDQGAAVVLIRSTEQFFGGIP